MNLILVLLTLASSDFLESNLNSFNPSECCADFQDKCKSLGNTICDDILNIPKCGFDFGDCSPATEPQINQVENSLNPFTKPSNFLSESQPMPNTCNFHYLGQTFPCNFQLFFFEVKNCSMISGSFEFNSLNQAVLNIDSLDGDLYLSGFAKIEKLSIKSSKNSRIFAKNLEMSSGFELSFRNNRESFVDSFRVSRKGVSFITSFVVMKTSSLELVSAGRAVKVLINKSRVYFSDVQVSDLEFYILISSCIFSIENADFSNISTETLFRIEGKSLVTLENIRVVGSTFSGHLFQCEGTALYVNNTSIRATFLFSSMIESKESSISLENYSFKAESKIQSFLQASDSSIMTLKFKILDTNLMRFAEIMRDSRIVLRDSEINSCIIQGLLVSESDEKYDFANSTFGKCLKPANPIDRQSLFSRNLNTQNSSSVSYEKLCQNGELLLEDPKIINGSNCILCKSGTYVDHSKPNDTACFICPEDFSKCENGTFKPKEGYFKFSSLKYSLVIRECPNKDACVGSKEGKISESSFITQCGENYDGDFCHSCNKNSTKTSLHICSKCPNKLFNALIIIGLVFMISLISYYLIKTTINSAFISQEMYSMGIKIFVNYFQIIYLCLQYKLKWPSEVKTLTSTKANGEEDDSSSGYFFSLKCLLELNVTEIDLFYYRTYFMNLMPVFLFVGSWMYYFILLCMKNVHNVKLYRTVILIVPFLLVYPSVITYSLAPLACLSLSKGKPEYLNEHVEEYHDFLIENRSIHCNNDHYIKVAAAVLVGVIIWGISVPGYIFYQIFKKRKNLFEHDIKFKYGFLFNGYLRNRYYWEFIIFIKKLMIVFLTVFMESEFNSNVQSILVVTILILFLILQIYYKPYFHETLNDLETFGCLAGMITILAGIIYTETDSGQYIIVYFLIFIIFLTNFSFLLYWLKFMTKEFIHYLVKNYNFLSRFRKDDGFEDDISKIFVHVKFMYIKEYQKLYTPIDDEDSSDNDKVAYKNSEITQLYTDIVNTGLERYKSNMGPNPRSFGRRESRFMS